MIIFKQTFFCFLFFITVCSAQNNTSSSPILPGAYQTTEYLPLLKNKKIAVVANPTSTIKGTHLVDTLLNLDLNIKLILSPEHGLRGNADAGEHLPNNTDQTTGIKVVSLYGAHFKPSSEDLSGIDVIIFDIQDVGARFYTYISTLQYVMEAAAENKIQLIVLDRPNPHSSYIDGPVLEPEFKSFVGMQSVPVVYAMTIGEYALMLNGEFLLQNKEQCDLKIIQMKNWDHTSTYTLPVKPSPNLPNQIAINLYPSLCFFEGTIVSVGRGTSMPFQIFGYPKNKYGDYKFIPHKSLKNSIALLYDGIECQGQNLVKDGMLKPGKINLSYLIEVYKNSDDKSNFFNNFFDKLSGTSELKKQLIAGESEDKIRISWQAGIEKFKLARKKYLLYKDFE